MFLNDFITIVAVNEGVIPDNQRRDQLALFEDIFFKLMEFIIGQRRNLGLELRVNFQIDHSSSSFSFSVTRNLMTCVLLFGVSWCWELLGID